MDLPEFFSRYTHISPPQVQEVPPSPNLLNLQETLGLSGTVQIQYIYLSIKSLCIEFNFFYLKFKLKKQQLIQSIFFLIIIFDNLDIFNILNFMNRNIHNE